MVMSPSMKARERDRERGREREAWSWTGAVRDGTRRMRIWRKEIE